MPRFFTDQIAGETAHITGEDAKHIGKVLRMAVGEALTLCDGCGKDYPARITSIDRETVTLQVLDCLPSATEPTVGVRLYQALPKGDKFELIVQKAVELGVEAIVPVMTHRCVSRPDPASMAKKLERYNRVALEAAKQSMRGRIPKVEPLLSWEEALEELAKAPRAILFYERADAPLPALLADCPPALSILVGAEGGFESWEVEAAAAKGLAVATLGPRILRCETAPLAALSAILYATGNMN